MTTTPSDTTQAAAAAGAEAATTLNWRLELVAILVTDVDRAKAFYVDQVGFNADCDVRVKVPPFRSAHPSGPRLLDLPG